MTEKSVSVMPLLSFRGITKRFGPLVANDAISLDLNQGEVLALLGENGAGKTTLMNILFGHYVAEEGEILVDGAPLPPGSTDAAIQAGIGMVHQHFTLAENLTVLENITLGTEPLFAWRRDIKAARTKIADMAAEYGLHADPDKLVGALSVGERQRVEILKALYRDARILILDEPTAVLTPQESDSLFETLKKLTAKGLAVIFISHKLNEILNHTNRVVVLRRGAVAGTVTTSEADRAGLARMMVGEEVNRPKVTSMMPGNAVLRLTHVDCQSDSEAQSLKDVSLEIRAHEIIGLAGVAGNGQRTLANLLSGLTTADAGDVEILGAPGVADPTELVRRGVGRIPEDRHATGVVGEMPLWENLISEDRRGAEIARAGFVIDKRRALERSKRLIEEFDIRCEGPEAETRLLSGGNMQKLILARVLSRGPEFILANQPVRGLDEGAIAYVQSRLLQARADGAGVLLISEDLDELFALSDRIAVMYHGRMTPPQDTAGLTVGDVGLLMSGHEAESAHAH
ncbi:ABC transporter ATP-binding protein [Nisaea nitritireducens]|uniref:ABC transporter ATP-binding protein n=1 Tax=Nisaea nitritireducens TaxID=568392 RepID=UPI0029BFE3F0|nr:ABC transporter ATP-binding protein [Nisaea nitritireducens]